MSTPDGRARACALSAQTVVRRTSPRAVTQGERSAGLALQSVNVPDHRVNGVFASDHDPVVAVYTVR